MLVEGHLVEWLILAKCVTLLKYCVNKKKIKNTLGNIFSRRHFEIQSTLVISKSKGLFEILRDIRTSTYQICRTEEKIIRTTTFNKYMCNWTSEVRDILKMLWKRGEIAP